MIKCIDIKEIPKGSNRGDSITKWTREYDILYPVPWCGIIIGIKLEQGKATPHIKSASARAYKIKDYSYQLSDVIYNNYTPQAGDLRGKVRTGGWHVDMFVSWDSIKQEGYVIGGNVGDQVSIRKITLQSMIADGTKFITHINGTYDYSIIEKPKPVAKLKIVDSLIISATRYDLHGKRTTSGAIFDRTKLTAAHYKLPMGTKAIIEYKGKKIQVVINDRCPRAGIIDLSPATCDSLKFKSGKVKLIILGQ